MSVDKLTLDDVDLERRIPELLPFAMILVVLMFRPTGLTPNMMSGIAYARRWLNRSKNEGT